MKWQPIKTAPAEEYNILVAWSDGDICTMSGNTARHHMLPRVTDAITTHWMPLPKNPNGT